MSAAIAEAAPGTFLRGVGDGWFLPAGRIFTTSSQVSITTESGIDVILSGTVKLVFNSMTGPPTTADLRGGGDLIGRGWFDHPNLQAVTTSRVAWLRIGADQFQAACRQHLQLAEAYQNALSQMLLTTQRRASAHVEPTLFRISRVLIELALRHGPALRLSQHDLAGLIGASRETVVRNLGILRQRNLVHVLRQNITVLDIEALTTFGEQQRWSRVYPRGACTSSDQSPQPTS